LKAAGLRVADLDLQRMGEGILLDLFDVVAELEESLPRHRGARCQVPFGDPSRASAVRRSRIRRLAD